MKEEYNLKSIIGLILFSPHDMVLQWNILVKKSLTVARCIAIAANVFAV